MKRSLASEARPRQPRYQNAAYRAARDARSVLLIEPSRRERLFPLIFPDPRILPGHPVRHAPLARVFPLSFELCGQQGAIVVGKMEGGPPGVLAGDFAHRRDAHGAALPAAI